MADAMITPYGLFIKMVEIPTDIPRLCQQYVLTVPSFKSSYQINLHRTIIKDGVKYLVLPRFLYPNLVKRGLIKEPRLMLGKILRPSLPSLQSFPGKDGKDCKDDIFPVFTSQLRHNQQIVFDHVISTVFHQPGGCIIKADTGMGKTGLAIALICHLRVKTLILTPPNKIIVEGWKAEFIKFTNIGTGKKDDLLEMSGIKVATSAANVNPREYSLIVFDEAHTFASPANREKFLGAMQVPYMLGLSATPDENGKELFLFIRSHIGPLVDAATLPGYNPNAVEFSGIVHVIEWNGGTTAIRMDNGNISAILTVKALVMPDMARAYRIICDLAQHLRNTGDCGFVYSELTEYLTLLYNIYMAEGCIWPAAYLDGKRKDEVGPNVRVIFVTYGIAKVGINYPRFTFAMYATPRKNKYTQTTGRILRQDDEFNSITRHIYDYVDVGIGFIKKQASERIKVYKQRGFKIIKK